MPELHFTMILSGAISLGSYEAGVVSQIAYAFEQWNQKGDGDTLIIDVVSGASAGAMTGAMLSLHLSHGTSALDFTQDNISAWCTNTTFENLIRMNRNDQNSLLSSTFIDGIASRCIALKQLNADPKNKPREVILSCALTAMNPIPFEFTVTTSGHKVNVPEPQAMIKAVTYRDGYVFRMNEAGVTEIPANKTMNEAPSHMGVVARVAAASGSIPIAWEPMLMVRDPKQYDPVWDAKLLGQKLDSVGVAYSDGGQLDNMPLDRAAAALGNVTMPGPDTGRIHILIIPDPPGDSSDALDGAGTVEGRDGKTWQIKRVLGRMYDAVSEQTFYRDLHKAQQFNKRLEYRDAFMLDIVKRSVETVEDIPAETKRVNEMLAEMIAGPVDAFMARYKKTIDPGSPIDKALNSLQPERQELFVRTLAASDIVADLDNKSALQVARIAPANANNLAGRAMGHFAGLVDAKLMMHDFNVGVGDAITWLKTLPNAAVSPPAELYGKVPGIAVPGDAQALWRSLPKHEKEHVKDDLIQRAIDYAADEIGANGFVRGGLHLVSTALEGFVHFPED